MKKKILSSVLFAFVLCVGLVFIGCDDTPSEPAISSEEQVAVVECLNETVFTITISELNEGNIESTVENKVITVKYDYKNDEADFDEALVMIEMEEDLSSKFVENLLGKELPVYSLVYSSDEENQLIIFTLTKE